MNRHFRRLDGSIPVAALLYEDEELVASQDGIGLYDGKEKSPDYQNGTVHITTHRLIYVDAANPRRYSTACNLSRIKQTDVYAGFLKSSAKVILMLSAHDDPGNQSTPDNDASEFVDDTTSETLVDDIPSREGWVCPICSYNNPASASESAPICVLCGVPKNDDIPMPQHKISSVSSPTTPARTPDPNARDMFKISFRKGGDKVWYAALKRTLLAKAWARAPPSKAALPSTQARGIHGILQSVEINAQTTQDDMEDALKDLEALMSKAREMADYAKLLNMKLTQQEQEDQRRRLESGYSTSDTNSHAPSDSETTFIRSSLARLGLPTDAVTQDMVADERAYHTELAKELGGLLLGGGPKGKSKAVEQQGIMEDSRGIVGLDEVWGAWNRARGVALLPPSTLLTVVPLLPNHTYPPIHMRTLRSGLRVLHTPDYTREAFAKRLDQSLRACFPQGRTSFQIAADEGAGVSLAMVQEMVECAEEDGAIARDEVGKARRGKKTVHLRAIHVSHNRFRADRLFKMNDIPVKVPVTKGVLENDIQSPSLQSKFQSFRSKFQMTIQSEFQFKFQMTFPYRIQSSARVPSPHLQLLRI
ncbi:hypothetical protein FRC07_005812 [Ceratobasidium sp. 392]|nr:hypothetical protein FRC07_005812 [Ceratobasidium sp. 392]